LRDYMKTVMKVETYQEAPPRATLLKFGGTLTTEQYFKGFKGNRLGVVQASDLWEERKLIQEALKKKKEEAPAGEEKKASFWTQVLAQLEPQALNVFTVAAIPDLGLWNAQVDVPSVDYTMQLRESLKLDNMEVNQDEDDRLSIVTGPTLNTKRAKALVKKWTIPKNTQKKVQAPRKKTAPPSTSSQPKAASTPSLSV
jgi:hypothetical protein